jgi:peroxin-2
MGDPAPTAWQQAWNNAQPRLAAISEAASSYDSPAPRILRVGQLDAELLDAELVRILREPIEKALALIHVRHHGRRLSTLLTSKQSSFRSRFDAELALFIQLVLYKLSVWDSGASYGAKIQGLRYRPHTAEPRLLTSVCVLSYSSSLILILSQSLGFSVVLFLHTDS